MASEGPRPRRAPAAFRQGLEYLLAAALVAGALHAGSSAALFVVAAVAVGGWAAVHDAPLRVVPVVHTSLHRAGLVVLALALVAAPVALGRWTDLAVGGPAGLVAIFLIQLSLPPRRPAPAPHQTKVPSSPARPTPPRAPVLHQGARLAGQVAGRTGTMIADQADRALPGGARQAGRLVGRITLRRPPH